MAAMIRRLTTKVSELIDGRELHVYGGLVLITAGLWPFLGPGALAVLGLGFVYIGLVHLRHRG